MRLAVLRAATLCILLMFPGGTAVWADLSSRPLPLPQNETLRFEITWKSLYVGYATLETRTGTGPDGAPVRRFTMTARTNPLVDIFFTVRNRIESETDAALTASRHYHKIVTEGGTKRDFEVFFQPGTFTARLLPHTDTLFPNATAAQVRTTANTFDPLAVFYALRQRPFPPNGSLQSPVCDGRRFDYAQAVDLGPAQVTTSAGTFSCRVVEMRLHELDGILRTHGPHTFTVWVADTPNRLPVAVESSVRIGPFSGVLRVALKEMP